MLGMIRWAVAALSAAVIWAGMGQPAHACGGFFCDGALPVNQAAERIIFAQDADETVTAVIQILYEGPSDEFSWVLPVPGVPEVQVSSDVAFQRLQMATNPRYQLTTEMEGTCADFRDSTFDPAPSAPTVDAGAVPEDGDAEPGVNVEDRGQVGPYDFVVISLDEGHAHPGDAAVDWLQENGYDVDDFGRDRLGPYLEGGQNLIAFRLTKNRDAGSVRPIRLTFGQGAPVIPIRPTAVAAVDNMGVMVWVLGPSRAVPINYLALELNEALINWFNPMSTYDDVVSAAADEAGGHGFVTEMAGDSTALDDVVMGSWEESEWEAISTGDWADRHGELVFRAAGVFGLWDGFADTFADHVPPPEGVSEEDFQACPNCYLSPDDATIEGFDPEAFVQTLAREVVEPMAETQTLLGRLPYVTRLYTTLSAHEMTVDPLFDFNPDLEDVASLRTATQVIECSEAVTMWEAPWRVELESGDVVRGQGTEWPFQFESGEMPLNRRVLDMSTQGAGVLVTDNVETIETTLEAHNTTVPAPPTGGGGCAVGGPAAPLAWAGLGTGLALLLWLRRRRPS